MKSLFVAMILASGNAAAQVSGAPLGTVASADATVLASTAGPIAAANARLPVTGGSTVTANAGHNAEVALSNGGAVLVCQTSGLHVAGSIPGPLLLALDRGAMEIRMKSNGNDSVLTPDLRFTMTGGGTLDLRVRVSFNGDTCVENRGRGAPTLRLTDAFGDTSYEVKPGQHVLFEHGSLREVVDRETTPCGCPPAAPAGVSIAEAALYGGKDKTSPRRAEAAHPFPAAVSEGLAAPSPVATEQPAGGTHVQVATVLAYDPTEAMAAAPLAAASVNADPLAPQPAQPRHSRFSAFFRGIKRIFIGT